MSNDRPKCRQNSQQEVKSRCLVKIKLAIAAVTRRVGKQKPKEIKNYRANGTKRRIQLCVTDRSLSTEEEVEMTNKRELLRGSSQSEIRLELAEKGSPLVGREREI